MIHLFMLVLSTSFVKFTENYLLLIHELFVNKFTK